ncbi:MAG: CoB--CoM heterodisulfide reductase iron-sulfur subunit A family protein [Candidatus Korarchaeum sp.]|nr:CoB--CoM heterodisulfide reductase iron-sulfur subunit A family protein [Candidatus Korarchaeum sp.]MDW8035739.1 CoB--CoM heterodisulfide reductase iron-sulfur subunit A family protein [Candidatus Korarchaeum sp.]
MIEGVEVSKSESEEIRIGVYICHCGLNIAGVIDVNELVEYAKTLPNVVIAKEYVFMCSAPGQNLIKEDIEQYKLNRVVIAACGPEMHEPTFRAAVSEANLNPFLMDLIAIREGSSWVHYDNPKAATEKAKDMIRMSVARVRNLEPLEKIRGELVHRALVVGGGVAGLTSALDLADRGFEVHLVERRPTLGGHVALMGLLNWGGQRISGRKAVGSLLNKLKENPKIIVHTNSDVIKVDGSIGNFKIVIRRKPRYVNEKCNLCGRCIEVCPVSVPNEYEYGLVERKAIYLPFSGAYPERYVIDPSSCIFCGKCVEVCPTDAINLSEKEEEIYLAIGAIVMAIGHDDYEPAVGEYGYSLSPRVITLNQLKRYLSDDGPTKGNLLVNGSRPKSIVFISCVGSLSTTPHANQYCSRTCCMAALSEMLHIKSKYPDSDIFYVHKDIRVYGKDEKLYWDVIDSSIKLVRFDEESPKVSIGKDRLYVEVLEVTLQERIIIPADIVVLVTGMTPVKDVDFVRSLFKVGCGGDGFLKELHLKLNPVESLTRGIFLAGTATGPKNVPESIVTGSAAAAKASILLVKDYIEVEPLVAEVDESKCSGCGICVSLCPFNAISIQKRDDGTKYSKIDPMLCEGCGTCVAACPSAAIQQYGYKDKQIIPQILAIFGR